MNSFWNEIHQWKTKSSAFVGWVTAPVRYNPKNKLHTVNIKCKSEDPDDPGSIPAPGGAEWRTKFLPLQEWQNLPQALFADLVGSMRRRLQACSDANGGHTQYWLCELFYFRVISDRCRYSPNKALHFVFHWWIYLPNEVTWPWSH